MNQSEHNFIDFIKANVTCSLQAAKKISVANSHFPKHKKQAHKSQAENIFEK